LYKLLISSCVISVLVILSLPTLSHEQMVGCGQGHDESGARGTQFPGRWITVEGAKWLRKAP